MQTYYETPSYVTGYLKAIGYDNPYTDMAPYVQRWYEALRSVGDFYDYSDKINGTLLKVHRRSIHPAARVADEWASLVMNEDMTVNCDEQACTDWLDGFWSRIGFTAKGQGLVKLAYALGTGAWALWVDADEPALQVRRHDARHVIPLAWDDDGITECAFVSSARMDGKSVTQLSLHLLQDDGYHIMTEVFDEDGKRISVDGVARDLATGCPSPTFAIVKPAKENVIVDGSPYGASVYADALDACQAVDLCFDATFNEVDLGKMRIFINDMLVDSPDDAHPQGLPFGRDNTVFRKVEGMATDNIIDVAAPALRTSAMLEAYSLSLRTLGDLCGFGLDYFSLDKSGGIRTATEVAADNSALMRNIRKHENLLADSVAQISCAVLHCAREFLGEALPDEGEVTVSFDDSIISDTAAEKAQDLAELNVTMAPYEYRMKWYGEDEETARARSAEVGGSAVELSASGIV